MRSVRSGPNMFAMPTDAQMDCFRSSDQDCPIAPLTPHSPPPRSRVVFTCHVWCSRVTCGSRMVFFSRVWSRVLVTRHRPAVVFCLVCLFLCAVSVADCAGRSLDAQAPLGRGTCDEFVPVPLAEGAGAYWQVGNGGRGSSRTGKCGPFEAVPGASSQ